MKTQAVQPQARQAALVAEQHRKMAHSAHAYVRGSTLQFYRWLATSTRRALPEGPPVWICGDCHAGNLGPVADGDGALAIQIRDLDQTVIGNPAHDLIRLALSLAMAARSSHLPGVTTAHMLEAMTEGYEAAFRPESDAASETSGAPGAAMPPTVRRVMRMAAGRSWKHLADERIEGVAPYIPLGKRFWPLTPDERAATVALFEQEDLRRLVTTLRRRDEDARVRVIDAAYWKKGCSSLGRLRLAALLSVGQGRHERHCLMDIKQAVAAAAPHAADAADAAMPADDTERVTAGDDTERVAAGDDTERVTAGDDAERVVAGARALSPHLGGRMVATRLLGLSVFVRELLPQDLKLEIERLDRAEAMNVARFLAQVVGRSHARQMAAAARAYWFEELGRNRSQSLDAPSWLWDSVVDLVSAHEAGYLQHCRRWALDEAA